ncbi:ERI2 [Bugula neritina]|uniref:ERI2 n=1 Tax=Bugula neritina TaxID=10212 RepID=A0A7J7KR35_BUGNE|nr:ERI2 [Bugula neritina]KAF6040555.1 ERI2 [Bugula neritina]
MAKTLELARQFGLFEERYFNSSGTRNVIKSAVSKGTPSSYQQKFTYVVIIDFESTCWNHGERTPSQRNEIIEFPALLVNINTGDILSQFHHYVQPLEQPTLSKFCMELTGITQSQVDEAFPIDIVMAKFRRWMASISTDFSFTFNSGDGELCAFATWTNWDLGICLAEELKRKSIVFPEQMKSWVDLKAVYKKFYSRSPRGLKQSMEEVGLEFEGREHSGIVDSRNTAKLLHKMVSDGCQIGLTKSSS